MSQQLRQLKSRIRSVEGTWKVTRAMEMVAMSKYKSLDAPLALTRAYFRKLESIALNLIGSNEEGGTHPFIAKPVGAWAKAPVGLLVITSEAGLCGVYNDHLLKTADKFIAAQKERSVKLYIFGRKAANHYKQMGIEIAQVFPAVHGKLKPDFQKIVYEAMTADFLKGRISEAHAAYTLFVNAMKQTPRVDKILTVEVPPAAGGSFTIESGAQGILNDILPMYISNRLRLMLLESFTSEHAARMVAMKAAKDNAKELMGDLILLRNKMRQTIITKEVIEIISSAEALKG